LVPASISSRIWRRASSSTIFAVTSENATISSVMIKLMRTRKLMSKANAA
jgi:hypothetical protein